MRCKVVVKSKVVNEFIKHGGVSSFQYELIIDGEMWMDMLEKRNILALTYDEARFEFAVNKIHNDYYKAIKQVHDLLGDKL